MERRVLVILIVAAVALSAALAWLTLSHAQFWHPHRGAARVQSEERDIGDFHKLELDGAADVELVQGATASVRVDTTADAPIALHVHNGTLSIDTHDARHGWRWLFNRTPRETPRIVVTFRDLTDIDASGTVKVRAAALRTPSLHVDVSGAGTLDLANVETETLYVEGAGTIKANIAGHARQQRIEISGAGNYQAPDLASESARVDVSGAGKVLVNVTQTLRVDISGAGSVAYIGNPTVQKSISGMGRVRQVPGKREVHVDEPPPAVPFDRGRPMLAA
ncbi:MAG TPA: head GIN domain-containing protein [Casimicrobiaceae bacterium]